MHAQETLGHRILIISKKDLALKSSEVVKFALKFASWDSEGYGVTEELFVRVRLLGKPIKKLTKEKLKEEIEFLQQLPGKRKREKRTSDGTWSFSSRKKKEWNASGKSPLGGDRPPDEMMAEMKRIMKEFGPPPDDVEWVY